MVLAVRVVVTSVVVAVVVGVGVRVDVEAVSRVGAEPGEVDADLRRAPGELLLTERWSIET